MTKLNRAHGFTLIELAIVLVVIGLLVGLGASLMGPLSKQAKYRESQEVVKGAKESIVGSVVKTGFLPISTAGARATDAWGRQVVYYRSTAFDQATEDVCGVTSTEITVKECQSGDCSITIDHNNIGFLLFSAGEDGNGGGTGVASPFTIREPGSTYIIGGQSWNYDDIAAYVSLDEIRSRRGCPQRLNMVPPALPQGEEDSFYAYSLQSVGGKPPYQNWNISWTPPAPTGLSIDANTGLLSGLVNFDAATNTGELASCNETFSGTASVSDSSSPVATDSKPITFSLRPKPVNIITQYLPVAFNGSAYTASIAATGGRSSAYTWNLTISPSNPGLTFSGNAISGTPLTTGNFVITAALSDGCGSSSRDFALTINASGSGGGGCAALILAPASGSNFTATQGVAFNQTITISGGEAPYSGCTSSTCNGLSLSCSTPTATISGTPIAPGTCTFNVGWTDSCSNPAPQSITGTYSVTINSPPCAGIGVSGVLPVANNCKTYTGAVNVVGGVPDYTWGIAPSPIITAMNDCNGQTSSSSSCSISSGNVLSAPGSYNFTTTVTDSCGMPQTLSQAFTIRVIDACYSSFTIRNNTATTYYYRYGATGACQTWTAGAVSSPIPASAGNTMYVYTKSGCNSNFLQCTAPLDYCVAKGLDTGVDCGIQTTAGSPCSFTGP